MVEWFVGFSLIGKIRVLYPVLPALLFALAYVELVPARKVEGAGQVVPVRRHHDRRLFVPALLVLLTGLIWLRRVFGRHGDRAGLRLTPARRS